jgi:hypothetical protein
MNKIFLNKKGQVGETVTWMVATVIIIAILGISFFIAEAYVGKDKEVSSVSYSKQVDILVSKSLFSYFLTDDIYNQIKTDGNFSDTNGPLAEDIFEGFYGEEYPKDIWLGVVFNLGLEDRENDYFGERPRKGTSGYLLGGTYEHVSESIKLNEEEFFEILLLKHETHLY